MKCENCGVKYDKVYGGGRFCSEKCARGFSTKYNRKEINKKVSRTLKQKYPKNIISKSCLLCNKLFFLPKPSSDKIFCSRECYWKSKIGTKTNFGQQTQESIRKRKETVKTKNYEKRKSICFEELNRYWQKQRLLKENNNCCMECGQPEEWNGKKLNLEFHHIDGNNKNNNRENCEVICPNCHSQTENYKFRNKKHKKENLAKITRGLLSKKQC